MKRKSLIAAMIITAFSCTLSPVFGAEVSTEIIDTEPITEEISTEVSSEVSTETSTEAEPSTEAEGSDLAGDGIDEVNAMQTAKSETSPNQINFTLDVPENFGLNGFALVMNKETGIHYNFALYSDIGYTERCFVPDGDYTVTDVAVYEDTIGLYSFAIPEDFTLTKGSVIDLSARLTNYEDIEAKGMTPSKYEPYLLQMRLFLIQISL